jgi:hypothetical protein
MHYHQRENPQHDIEQVIEDLEVADLWYIIWDHALSWIFWYENPGFTLRLSLPQLNIHNPLSQYGYAVFKLQSAKYISALIHHDINIAFTFIGIWIRAVAAVVSLVLFVWFQPSHRRFLGIDMRYCRRPKS